MPLKAIADYNGMSVNPMSLISVSRHSVVDVGVMHDRPMVRKRHFRDAVTKEKFRDEWNLYITLASVPVEVSGVLPLRAVDHASKHQAFYFDHAPLGTVHSYCHQYLLSTLQRMHLCLAMAIALRSLHSTLNEEKICRKPPIAHFDFKPGKALLSHLTLDPRPLELLCFLLCMCKL
jgi:hypothetical protein